MYTKLHEIRDADAERRTRCKTYNEKSLLKSKMTKEIYL